MAKRQIGSLESELKLAVSSRDSWQVCIYSYEGSNAQTKLSSVSKTRNAWALSIVSMIYPYHVFSQLIVINILSIYQAMAKDHEEKLAELISGSLLNQSVLSKSKAEAQSHATQSQASQLKAKHIESDLQVGLVIDTKLRKPS